MSSSAPPEIINWKHTQRVDKFPYLTHKYVYLSVADAAADPRCRSGAEFKEAHVQLDYMLMWLWEAALAPRLACLTEIAGPQAAYKAKLTNKECLRAAGYGPRFIADILRVLKWLGVIMGIKYVCPFKDRVISGFTRKHMAETDAIIHFAYVFETDHTSKNAHNMWFAPIGTVGKTITHAQVMSEFEYLRDKYAIFQRPDSWYGYYVLIAQAIYIHYNLTCTYYYARYWAAPHNVKKGVIWPQLLLEWSQHWGTASEGLQSTSSFVWRQVELRWRDLQLQRKQVIRFLLPPPRWNETQEIKIREWMATRLPREPIPWHRREPQITDPIFRRSRFRLNLLVFLQIQLMITSGQLEGFLKAHVKEMLQTYADHPDPYVWNRRGAVYTMGEIHKLSKKSSLTNRLINKRTLVLRVGVQPGGLEKGGP